MAIITYHRIDAFAERVFTGNPAAVVVLEGSAQLEDALMQSIAGELNLSETAFVVSPASKGTQRLRWFTPTGEIELCGHGTLAAASVVLTERGQRVEFTTLSGSLFVTRQQDDRFTMEFPQRIPERTDDAALRAAVASALRVDVGAVRGLAWAVDLLVELPSAEAVRELRPDLSAVAELDGPGLCVTAAGDVDDGNADFVSRVFGPKLGIPEDPVTGSTHCALAPWWSTRLGKTVLQAHQLSARGGRMTCEWLDDRVTLTGRAVYVGSGTIALP